MTSCGHEMTQPAQPVQAGLDDLGVQPLPLRRPALAGRRAPMHRSRFASYVLGAAPSGRRSVASVTTRGARRVASSGHVPRSRHLRASDPPPGQRPPPAWDPRASARRAQRAGAWTGRSGPLSPRGMPMGSRIPPPASGAALVAPAGHPRRPHVDRGAVPGGRAGRRLRPRQVQQHQPGRQPEPDQQPAGDPENYLIVAVDTREGQASRNTDTIMVARADPESDRLALTSFPAT